MVERGKNEGIKVGKRYFIMRETIGTSTSPENETQHGVPYGSRGYHGGGSLWEDLLSVWTLGVKGGSRPYV